MYSYVLLWLEKVLLYMYIVYGGLHTIIHSPVRYLFDTVEFLSLCIFLFLFVGLTIAPPPTPHNQEDENMKKLP